MSQFDFGTIDPNVKTGTQLAADLNQWRTALHSSHAGVARPAYAAPGMLWMEQTNATDWRLRIVRAAGDRTIASGTDGGVLYLGLEWTSVQMVSGSGPIVFVVNGLERANISATGVVKATASTGGYVSPANIHEFTVNSSGIHAFHIANVHSSNPNGLNVKFPSIAAPARTNLFTHIICTDSAGTIFQVNGNGGVGNFQANDFNFCDATLKENIEPSPDYTSFVEQLAFRNFTYKDMPQAGAIDDVIAQEIEALAPDLVDTADGVKVVYAHRLQQRINSVIPRLLARIRDLDERIKRFEDL